MTPPSSVLYTVMTPPYSVLYNVMTPPSSVLYHVMAPPFSVFTNGLTRPYSFGKASELFDCRGQRCAASPWFVLVTLSLDCASKKIKKKCLKFKKYSLKTKKNTKIKKLNFQKT
ncbi:hypothetical protein CsSME_00049301 [Camellia sinensis var. sinensis]